MLSTDNKFMNYYQKNNNMTVFVSTASAAAFCALLCLNTTLTYAQVGQNHNIAGNTPLTDAHKQSQSNPTYVKTANGFPIVLPRLSGDAPQVTPEATVLDASQSALFPLQNDSFFSPPLAYTPPTDVTKEGINQESISSDTISESIQQEAINVPNAQQSSPLPTNIAGATPSPATIAPPPAVADPSPSPVVAESSPSPSPATAAPSTITKSTTQSAGGQWDEVGYASWYGGKFQGRQTANGETFDTNKLTAAHKTLPFNSMVQVYNPTTQQSVLVRINDRGPFVESRIIDLSRAAASVIGLTSQGISQVYIKVVSEGVSQDLKLIQLGSFGVYENAVDLKTELEQAGIKVEIESSANSIYRVIVPNLTADELLAMRTRLADVGYSDVLIRSVR